MSDIVIITLLRLLANANTWTETIAHDEWLKTFLKLPSGIPSHDTIQRVIEIINSNDFYTSTVKYLINSIDILVSKST